MLPPLLQQRPVFASYQLDHALAFFTPPHLEELKEQVDIAVDPDCPLFAYDGDVFQPASCASGTRILRAFLREYRLSKVATFHSVKATTLSWMRACWNSLFAQPHVFVQAGHSGGQLPAQDQPVALQTSVRVAPASACFRFCK